MSFDRRKAAWFALTFLPVFALAIWLYPHLLPPWERAVLLLSNPVLESFTPSLTVRVVDAGALFAYIIEPDGTQKAFFTRPYQPYVIFISLVLLPSLLLATPVSPRDRLRLLLYGMLLLYAIHVITIIALFRVYLCLMQSPGATMCTWIKGLLLTSGQITPVAAWGLLTWKHWFPKDTSTP